jgi:hypothetical protein
VYRGFGVDPDGVRESFVVPCGACHEREQIGVEPVDQHFADNAPILIPPFISNRHLFAKDLLARAIA